MAGPVGLRDVRYEAVDTHFQAKDNSGKANPQWMPKDDSNPYFTYDPAKCIVCSRCVRACEEVQGTFALTIEGRGFDSRVSAGMTGDDFLTSDCVSCGACVQACPTATLQEKSIIEIGTPARSVDHHLRLLRRRLQLQGRDARRRTGADDALQARQGQPRPFLRQGALRLWLCQPQGPHPEPDDPRDDRRPVAGGVLGRGDGLRGEPDEGHSGEARAAVGRGDHLVPLHQ